MSGMDGMHACLSTDVPRLHNCALSNRADWHALLSQAQHKTSKDMSVALFNLFLLVHSTGMHFDKYLTWLF